MCDKGQKSGSYSKKKEKSWRIKRGGSFFGFTSGARVLLILARRDGSQTVKNPWVGALKKS